MLETGSLLRPALPDLIRLMLDFTTFAIHPPSSGYFSNKSESIVGFVCLNLLVAIVTYIAAHTPFTILLFLSRGSSLVPQTRSAPIRGE